MMKFKSLFLAGVLLLGLAGAGCTQNERAKMWGGTAEVSLPPGRKLVNVTFKETNIWLLTRAAHKDEKPETFEFIEKSNAGLLEGKIIIREQQGLAPAPR